MKADKYTIALIDILEKKSDAFGKDYPEFVFEKLRQLLNEHHKLIVHQGSQKILS